MADDGALAQFVSFTGTTPETARQYLGFTDGDVQQAIELFFANDGADLVAPSVPTPSTASQAPPVPPASTRPQPRPSGRQDSEGIVHIDSDSDPDYMDDDESGSLSTARRQSPPHREPGSTLQSPHGLPQQPTQSVTGLDEDEAIARRLQEEMYGEAGMGTETDPERIRAPIGRTTETLIGPDSFDPNDPEDMHAAVLEQVRARQRPRPRDRPGIFNQATNSIWNEGDSSSTSNRERLARATAGASETSNKSRSLAEMYRPPYELMSRLPWDQARQEGKEGEKWILVNIQDPSIFDCQILNRDIWKDAGIMDTVRENFIFMQYTKDDQRGNQYMQYYFQARESQDAYPHIAIVDPRTGEQVKVWSGAPAPKPVDFLMQLHEFLDRYSLKATAKNPVARRKPETRKESQVGKMTEEQMLEMAMQNSLAGNEVVREDDPDELTRSVHKDAPSQCKEQETSDELTANGSSNLSSPFADISSSKPHTEPPSDTTSTRIQFRHPSGRIVRRFALSDSVRRIYEWLKASPLEGMQGVGFELISMQRNLIGSLETSIEQAGLKNGTVMIEFLEG